MMTLVRIGLCAGALVFGGCGGTTTLQLPATELVTLSTTSVRAASEWPKVRTVAGPPQKIMGTIERIQIKGNQVSEPIQLPFAARVNGPSLEVFEPAGRREFPLTDDLQVTVEYSDLKKKRNIEGGVLIGVGASLFIGGIVLFGLGWDTAERNEGLNQFQGLPGILVGAIGIYGGLRIAIPGINLVTTDPKKSGRDTASIQPKLHIGPTGGNLTIKF